MPNRKRNQTGIFTSSSQGYSRPMRSRGESIYGTDYDDGNNYDGDDYHSPRRPVATPYVGMDNETGRDKSPYDDYNRQRPDDNSNYGRGGYYGSTYGQEQDLSQRYGERDRNRPGWRNSDDRNAAGRRGEYERGPDHFQGDQLRDDRNFRWPLSRTSDDSFNRGEGNGAAVGMHRGKGPRGYQRADDRIRDDINDRLADDPFLDATEIEVIVLNGDVTLSGTVDHRADKRWAEDICEDIGGVKNVENRLRVKQTFGDPHRDKTSSSTEESKETSRRRTIG